MVISRLPEADSERVHGLKYSLFYGRSGKCLVRYDNERGKGDLIQRSEEGLLVVPWDVIDAHVRLVA